MMSRVLIEPKKYFSWWLSTLKSCLPQQTVALFKKYNKAVDLVIRHQGDTIFLQDSHGRIINSIAIDAVNEVDDVQEAALDIKLYAVQDGVENIRNDICVPDIDITEQAENIHRSLDISAFNLDEIDLTQREDSTIVFSSEDKTMRLSELTVEDDTLVIHDDQGALLNLGAENAASGDSTILYFSDKGKIRPIESKGEPSTDRVVDFNLAEDTTSPPRNDESYSEFDLAAGLLTKHSQRKKCLYLIPDERVFTLVLNYPVEVLENIESVLRYDLEKHIPLNFSEVRFFYALNMLSAKRKVDVEIVVIKSTVYDELEAAFELEGKREIICTTRKFYDRYGSKINILGKRKGKNKDSQFSFGNLHTVVNILLLIGLFLLPYQMLMSQLDAIQPKSKSEIMRAGEIVATINQLNAEIELGSQLNIEIGKDHRMIELLAQLSDQISTDAWISRFTYKNGELRLKGEAVSATAVSDDLNDTGLFESIKFVSSIIKNPNTRKETFELSLKVKTDA